MERGTEWEIRTALQVLPQEYFILHGTLALCSISYFFNPLGFRLSSLVWQVYGRELKTQSQVFKPTPFALHTVWKCHILFYMIFNFSPEEMLIQAFYLKSKLVRICYFLNGALRSLNNAPTLLIINI